ncbi:MAG: restriction endonuclease subunit S [Thermodesulfobacteriota bacterium]|nr:restriction endonuclease subunit S [Thermodesulfobacteriota bacterium]
MIDGLKPYTEYKESGQTWLGDVPSHWYILPNRAIFEEVKERGHSDEEMLSVTIKRGVIRQKALLADSSKKDGSNQNKLAYKLVCPNDIAYNKMRAWQGAVGVSNFRGIVSPAYVIMRIREKNDPRYFHHLFRTPHFAKEAERWSYGITSDMWSLRPEHFKMIYMPLPSTDEQAAIVKFLDHATRRLNRAIRAKQKVIALLNEQRQGIIHRTVTRGLDPDVPLKPSGIPWLGDIPKHWGVVALGRISTARCDGPFGSGLKSQHYTDYGIRVIRLQNIGSGHFNDRNTAYISRAHYNTLGDHSVIAGDLLVAGLGEERIPAGRACIAPDRIEPAMVKADCFRFRLRKDLVLPEFIAHDLSATAKAATACLSRGATRLRINLSSMSSRAIAFPKLQEQKQILSNVYRDIREAEVAISHREREITLLREFRTRLIADVVTGKLDVREAARRISDETEAVDFAVENGNFLTDTMTSIRHA